MIIAKNNATARQHLADQAEVQRLPPDVFSRSSSKCTGATRLKFVPPEVKDSKVRTRVSSLIRANS